MSQFKVKAMISDSESTPQKDEGLAKLNVCKMLKVLNS